MISDLVRKQIAGGEGPAVEFVRGVGDFERLSATICAFLNTRGGVVFVGVEDDGAIVGVPAAIAETQRRQLESHLQNAISPKALFTVSVDPVDESERALLTVEAPQGQDVPYVVDGRAFLRKGARTAAATAAELRRMIQDRSVQAERWERRICPGLELEDLVTSEVDATVDDAGKSDRFAFEAGLDNWDVLRRLGLASSSGLTQGCDVLFGARPAERHPQCRVRYIRFASDKIGDAYEDSQWFQGPLVRVFNDLIERLRAQVRVQALFQPGQHTREDRPNYSLDALREGLVNAIAHRDYSSFSGGVTLSVYPGHIEIWNSGRLPAPLTVRSLRGEHPSIPPNPDIAHVLYLRGLMERVGRGTQKIISACQEIGARPPNWEEKPSGVTLTLFASVGGATPQGIILNSRQAALIEQLRPGDSIKLYEYARKFAHDVSERQARRDLADLEALGLLTKIGQARATIYQRTEHTV